MRAVLGVVAALLLAGCLGGPTDQPESPMDPVLNPLEAPGAAVYDEGRTRAFAWSDALGPGAAPPLVAGSTLDQWDAREYAFPVDESVGTLTVDLDATAPAVAHLRTADGTLACVARSGRVCTIDVHVGEQADWTLRVTSIAPEGTSFEVRAVLNPDPATYGDDPTPGGGADVYNAQQNGGEPTLAVLADGRVLVVAGTDVLRLELDGTFTDVTPPADATAPLTLDPFLVGDPETDRVYVSQLAQCMRVSWTEDAGATWVTNPFACAGPEQHHQKMTVGPGPAGRTVHIGMMNLASWLTTDEVVVFHSRSFDGGLTWSQNPAMTRASHGLEARAIGNIAATDDGAVHMVAYLCDAFVDAQYRGLGVGRSTDYGATWTWQRIAPGGGRCEGIDPGIAAAGNNLYTVWWDQSSGAWEMWHASSPDSGATWTAPARLPTPGLHSFVFADAAASDERLVAAFLANPDTARGPTMADGWSRWYPYLATLDLTAPDAEWDVRRLQDDPVQVGPICMDGPMCMDGARNLLDFIDVQIGPDGLARVAYPDGCDEDCDAPWESRGAELRVAVERPAS